MAFLVNMWHKFTATCKNIQAFQERIWIVSIQDNETEQGTLFNDTFVVNEDDFSSSMSWMHKRGYSDSVIKKIDAMKRSQVVKVNIKDQFHSLIRVK